MNRKKWTKKNEITEALLKFRVKRKWQVALRRYIIEKIPSQAYAPYFGLDIGNLRKWIELQFKDEVRWENFGTLWQFDHIVPVTYFDFSNRNDLILCWNFINIRVEKNEFNKNRGNRIDVLAAKPYFQSLYKKTGNILCNKMVDKITEIQISAILDDPLLENFIIDNREYLEVLSNMSSEEFNRVNQGISIKDILLEREIIRKFG